jgi:predicted nucleic acid-binding protein
MILYCDTSALVKLYVLEAESAAVKALVSPCEAVATSRITWAEAHAAFSRRAREVPADAEAMEAAKHSLAKDWPRILVMDVTQSVVAEAGELADTFALRGYDSVQLASSAHVMRLSKLPVAFACFDGRLNKAAKFLGMDTPFAQTS